tara:strand:+ start:218 stop:451 length:234 start_codon:yes stop_codon:yes gene_type:complete
MKHLKEQPLHQTLKQYRLISVISVFFLGFMMYKAWVFFEVQHGSLTTEGAAGFFTYMAALIAAFIKSIASIQGAQSD